MTTCRISDEDQGALLQIVSGILHLGNITFVEEANNFAVVENPNGVHRVAAGLTTLGDEGADQDSRRIFCAALPGCQRWSIPRTCWALTPMLSTKSSPGEARGARILLPESTIAHSCRPWLVEVGCPQPLHFDGRPRRPRLYVRRAAEPRSGTCLRAQLQISGPRRR